MKENKQLSIIGATGKLGVPVTRYLLQLGFQVKIIARNVEKAQSYFGKEKAVTIVHGDLQDESSLRAALKGTAYLYLHLSTMTTDVNIPFSAEREGVANLLKAADRNSIRHILMISGLGAFQPNGDSSQGSGFVPNIIRRQGQHLLKESGIPYTILHCSYVMDSFLAYQRNGSYPLIGAPEHSMYFINLYDYSRQLARAAGNPKAFNKEYPIQGKEGLKHLDAAKTFLGIYSPKAKVQVMPSWLINIMALFIKDMKFVKHMAKYFGSSRERFLAEQFHTYQDLGEPELSLKDYAQKVKYEGIYPQ